MSRIKFLKFLLYAVAGLTLGRLFVVQIVEHDMWVAKATETHTAEIAIPAERGEIYMMDGNEPVAVVLNNTVYTVIVDPMVANEEKVAETIDRLAQQYEVAKWEDVFKNKSLRYYVVAKKVPYTVAQEIKNAGLSGVWFKEGNSRVYPEGQMAAQLLGFVNTDGVGQYGIEGAWNKTLAGQDGMLKSVVDVNNVALSIGNDNVKTAAVDGEGVVLTIDKNIQVTIEQKLSAWLEKYGEKAHGAAIVMDPNTGKILAMANVPTYDPANYGKVSDITAYVNYTTEVPYEPASMCKTFAFAAGIDTGVMNANTTYNNTGRIVVDQFAILNAASNQPYGTITMQRGLNFSLNTSSVWALTLLGGVAGTINQKGREVLYDYYYNHFGLAQKTGVEVLEAEGIMVGPNAERDAIDLTYANMTFGQGLNLTMVQVAAAFSALVNGGVYHTPTVVAGLMTADGTVVAADTAKERNTRDGERVVSESTSTQMREMLYGTRNLQRIYGIDKAGYYIGGKSGTAQRIMEDGSYSDVKTGETIAGYIGFGGAAGEDPEFVLMVKLWGDDLRFEGSSHARAVWNELMAYLLDYLQVQPAL